MSCTTCRSRAAHRHGHRRRQAGDQAATRNASKQPGYAAARSTAAREPDITTSGKVRLFGMTLENPKGVVDNFGVVSVNVKSFDANRPGAPER
jgi:hypothetical protein